jgi:ATP-binding cassette subfamily B protein
MPDSINRLKKSPLLFYIGQNKRAFGLGMFFLIVTNTLDALYPLILKQGIDQVVAKAQWNDVLKTSLLFFGMMTSLALTRLWWRTFFGRYHTLAAEDLRNRLFHHLTTMGPSFFQKNPVGELMSLITNDVQSFRNGIGNGVLVLVDSACLFVLLLPIMISLNPVWAWKTLIFLPLVPFIIWKLTQVIFKNYKAQQDRLSELSGISQEIIAGIRVIKSFVQEKVRLGIYNRKSREFELSSNKTFQADALFGPVMEFGVASGSVILLLVAADDVLSGIVTVGTLVAFQRYIQKMVWPVTALGLGLSQYQKGMASFRRIREVLEQKSDIPDEGNIEIKDFKALKVQRLSFQYPGSLVWALKDISFEIQPGQTVGLVGPVGSGKSTLVSLLSRLYPASQESIFINDIPIENITQRSLHSQLVLVPQEPFLFSESINQNINFTSEEENPAEVLEWARVVDIDHEIETLPMKFESALGERGVNLSGGQKQRMTIARGLMTKAPFIILDDSLSAVDTKTEKSIQDRLRNSDNRTQLIIAHRLSTVEHADRILVLNQGRLEATGTHLELLQKSATYRELASIQGYPVEVSQ